VSKPVLRRDKLAFDDPEALQALCGTNNTRLKLIERTAGAQLHLRGNEITIEADDDVVRVVRSALEQLYAFARKGKHLASDDVVRALKVLSADGSAELAPIFSDTVLVPRAGRPIAPKGVNAEAVRRSGPRPTTSRSASAPPAPARPTSPWPWRCARCSSKQVRRIILTRPAVEAGEKLGFLPGTLEEKVNPYLRPLYDALHDMLDKATRPEDDGRRRHRGGAAGVHARPHAQRRVRDPRRGAEHHRRADEDVPHPPRLRLEGGDHGRSVADRPAARASKSGLRDALHLLEGIRGIASRELHRRRRGAPPAGREIIRAYDARDRARSEYGEARPWAQQGRDGDRRDSAPVDTASSGPGPGPAPAAVE
jgi:phosphate starvation-inducible PhoH-like protein